MTKKFFQMHFVTWALGLSSILTSSLRAETRGIEAGFIKWCEQAETDASVRPVVDHLLWEAGAPFWWHRDCIGAAPIVVELEVLDLHGANLADIRPLASLKLLKQLNLERNAISDISPLVSLTNLESLDLQHNRVYSIQALVGLAKLNTLYLYGNPIGEHDLRDFTHLDNQESALEWKFPWATFAKELPIDLGFNLLVGSAFR